VATAPKRPDDELPRGMSVDAFLAWTETRRGRVRQQCGADAAIAIGAVSRLHATSATHPVV